jgi:ribosomal protein S18 acetylase RimI-like enzyme
LYVDPRRWRIGVGRALLSDALERLRRQSYERVTLWVFESNLPARNFYDTFGFEPDGASKRHETGPVAFNAGPVQIRLRLRLRLGGEDTGVA